MKGNKKNGFIINKNILFNSLINEWMNEMKQKEVECCHSTFYFFLAYFCNHVFNTHTQTQINILINMLFKLSFLHNFLLWQIFLQALIT